MANSEGQRKQPPAGAGPRAAVSAVCSLLFAIVLPACRIGGSSSVEAENDRLRREVRALQDRVAALEHERDELRAKVSQAPDPQAAEAEPLVVQVEIDRLSGLTPPGPEAPARAVTFYVDTRDGRRRFVQAVGTLTVSAALAPPNAPERPLAERTLTPTELRDAYRSGFFGTHYTVEAPLREPLPRPAPGVVLRVSFRDAQTGRTLTAERHVEGR